LCCVGNLTFDVAVRQQSLIHGQQSLGGILFQMGGSAAIVAFNAASLRVAVRFVGLAGADAHP